MCRPIPQIGFVWPFCASIATTVPICRASGAPIVVGQAFPLRLTQSIPSSFVNSIGRSNPCASVARKFEQNRWKFWSDVIAYEPLRTPPECCCNRSWLTSAFVKSLKPLPVPVVLLKV